MNYDDSSSARCPVPTYEHRQPKVDWDIGDTTHSDYCQDGVVAGRVKSKNFRGVQLELEKAGFAEQVTLDVQIPRGWMTLREISERIGVSRLSQRRVKFYLEKYGIKPECINGKWYYAPNAPLLDSKACS